MNKKIQFVCFLAVSILIIVIISPVIGTQSKISDYDKSSPLFVVRNKEAIEDAFIDIQYDYLGNGKKIDFSITKNHENTEKIRESLNVLNKMDKRVLKKLLFEIQFNFLKFKKNNDEIFPLNYNIKNNNYVEEPILFLSSEFTIGAWFPGCWLFKIIFSIANSIQTIFQWINNIRNSISYIVPGCCKTWN